MTTHNIYNFNINVRKINVVPKSSISILTWKVKGRYHVIRC